MEFVLIVNAGLTSFIGANIRVVRLAWQLSFTASRGLNNDGCVCWLLYWYLGTLHFLAKCVKKVQIMLNYCPKICSARKLPKYIIIY